jgi:hypothetical protein
MIIDGIDGVLVPRKYCPRYGWLTKRHLKEIADGGQRPDPELVALAGEFGSPVPKRDADRDAWIRAKFLSAERSRRYRARRKAARAGSRSAAA